MARTAGRFGRVKPRARARACLLGLLSDVVRKNCRGLAEQAGLRAEELTELTHLSVRQYQRPNGEVVALLVISPSKTDRGRVIPMSAELFHVIAQIIRRHRNEHGTVPVCARYDPREKVWSEELPYLFQAFAAAARERCPPRRSGA
jgi:hypothetical protein